MLIFGHFGHFSHRGKFKNDTKSVSVGHQDLRVLTDSMGRREFENRIFKINS